MLRLVLPRARSGINGGGLRNQRPRNPHASGVHHRFGILIKRHPICFYLVCTPVRGSVLPRAIFHAHVCCWSEFRVHQSHCMGMRHKYRPVNLQTDLLELFLTLGGFPPPSSQAGDWPMRVGPPLTCVPRAQQKPPRTSLGSSGSGSGCTKVFLLKQAL